MAMRNDLVADMGEAEYEAVADDQILPSPSNTVKGRWQNIIGCTSIIALHANKRSPGTFHPHDGRLAERNTDNIPIWQRRRRFERPYPSYSQLHCGRLPPFPPKRGRVIFSKRFEIVSFL
uniref:Uncharacterized protein n=1 Tax=Branchiostoma floridae TaxID=7739 RepID=C3Y852_BRAFL|eukprot:XP_002607511.1 hypothetical protein BRAFLDRAFT_69942 [Branchiostoma floridae]